MKSILTVIILWLAIGLIGSGFSNAYFTKQYKSCNGRQELGFSLAMAIGGPINLFVIFLLSGFGEYGWSLEINNDKNCILKGNR